MKALGNLPKTLDETYDRIFTLIPKEERLFVHHVLRWIAHHNELWEENGMPCEVLIEAASASTLMLTAEPNEGFYDQDVLREICGCLIDISPMKFPSAGTESRYNSINFAHYTVFEYLESRRFEKNASAYHGAVEETSREHLIEVTMLQAQNVNSQTLRGLESEEDSQRVIQAVYSNFANYCAASGVLYLYRSPDHLLRQSKFRKLIVDFLNPSKPHFETMVRIATAMHDVLDFGGGFGNDTDFWNIVWNSEVSTEARHLYILLLICEEHKIYFPLVQEFLQGNDRKYLLQSRVTFETWAFAGIARSRNIHDNLLFDGSIFEVFTTQSRSMSKDFILFLFEKLGAGLFDPSVTLLLSIKNHDHSICIEERCLVRRLLELEADPNLTHYIVTPLQIATYCLDVEGVSMLLKYGAHPNSTGCSDGIIWKEGTTMSYSHHLHGASPLRILRKYTYFGLYYRFPWIPENRKKLEELLLHYGAEEISATPQAALDELPYNAPEWREWATASPQRQARTSGRIEDHLLDSSADT